MFGNLFTQRNCNPNLSVKTPVPEKTTTERVVSSSSTQLNVNGIPLQQSITVEKNIVGSTMEPDRRQDLSALSHLDSRTSQVLLHAQQEATRTKQPHIEPDHILFGLLFDEEIFKLLEQFSVDSAKLSHEL